MTPAEAAASIRHHTDHDLEINTSSTIASDMRHIAARIELARRKSRRAFWGKDIVAWIALAISTLSLLVSILSLARVH